MCMIEDSDGWEPFGPIERKARKVHRCGECRRDILPGETYRVDAGVSDGRVYTTKTCQQCLAAAQWLVKVCSGYLFEAVYIDLEQHWCEEPDLRSLWLGRAIIGMKRKWRRADGSLMDPLPDPDRSIPIGAKA